MQRRIHRLTTPLDLGPAPVPALHRDLEDSEMAMRQLLEEITNGCTGDKAYADEAVIPETLRTVLLELRDYRDRYAPTYL